MPWRKRRARHVRDDSKIDHFRRDDRVTVRLAALLVLIAAPLRAATGPVAFEVWTGTLPTGATFTWNVQTSNLGLIITYLELLAGPVRCRGRCPFHHALLEATLQNQNQPPVEYERHPQGVMTFSSNGIFTTRRPRRRRPCTLVGVTSPDPPVAPAGAVGDRVAGSVDVTLRCTRHQGKGELVLPFTLTRVQ
jgi:hypothetical protein